jgi:hypothetical protein
MVNILKSWVNFTFERPGDDDVNDDKEVQDGEEVVKLGRLLDPDRQQGREHDADAKREEVYVGAQVLGHGIVLDPLVDRGDVFEEGLHPLVEQGV